MTTLRHWLARVLASPEPFPVEFRAERLDQPRPLARSRAWYEGQQAERVRYWLR